ncbi:MAG: hypothetical protein R2755_28020 [Acidimicrobiales bacterium]
MERGRGRLGVGGHHLAIEPEHGERIVERPQQRHPPARRRQQHVAASRRHRHQPAACNDCAACSVERAI